ncbi:MAG: acyl-CoA thioesterase [Bdellovibrionales bacterium]
MNPEIFEYPFLIREVHLDTFGHVNNAAYLQIFEEARWDIITNRGFGLKHVKETQTGPVILGIEMKFQKELKNREQIVIKSWSTPFTGSVAVIEQQMINAKGEVACWAKFTFAMFDLKARKLISPTPQFRHAVGLPT